MVLVAFISCQNPQSKSSPETSRESSNSTCENMIAIPGGSFWMGGDNEQAEPDEYPKHKVSVSDFYLDEHEVSNAEFSAFVVETGYVTVAEREVSWEELKKSVPAGTPKPHDSILQPGSLVFHKTETPVPLDDVSQWWRWTIGADWRHPRGPDSDIEDKMDHPVVHVAWEDANAYCQWKNKRLPTEAEWEWASRGGQENQIYSWGSGALDDDNPKANYWQGVFPYQDKMKDGYSGTAPIKSYASNAFGLYDMAGNVWEWCSDWYDHDFYRRAEAQGELADPAGPDKSYDPGEPYAQKKVLRGGSYLCNENYCSGYRNSRRMRNTVDTGMEHIGFRCACDK